MAFGQDSDFSVEGLLRRYADDLANDLGNLLHRVLPMIARYRQGHIPAPTHPDPILHPAAKEAACRWERTIAALDFRAGLEAIWAFLSTVNRFVDQAAPWSLAKNGKDNELDEVLYSAAEAIRLAALLVAPVMPDSADEIERQLGFQNWQRRWSQASEWGVIPGGQQIAQPAPLFPRAEPRREPGARQKGAAKGPSVSASHSREVPMITLKEFQNVDLRIGEILSAEVVEGADKLLKLTVAVGDERRTMVAGVALSYRPEELVGRQVVVVANLEPATIRGVRSEGMILAGWVKGDDKSIAIVTPDRPLPNGVSVS
jgi:methionyl-tRNA synthetase